MKTLEEAWRWHNSNKKILKIARRLGDRYWDLLPWDGPMGNDDFLRNDEGIDIKQSADDLLSQLDDLAIFVIFSVFEAIVRDRVGESVKREVASFSHPALKRFSVKLIQNIEEGSFYANVLELYKVRGNEPGSSEINSLVENVSTIRRYRNWVAHGRRSDRKPSVISPKDAYDRLSAFLAHLGPERP